MKRRDASRPVIDTAEFARRGDSLGGVRAARDFARLREALASDRGEISWRLAGERHPRHEGGHDDTLLLTLSGEVDLQCTRCLQPVAVAIGERRLFRLFATEAQALREDAQADDFDALVGGTRFDPLALVEDEALLALPIAPRHGRCEPLEAPGATASGEPGDAGSARANPFAALAAIKGRPPRR